MKKRKKKKMMMMMGQTICLPLPSEEVYLNSVPVWLIYPLHLPPLLPPVSVSFPIPASLVCE
jgi:hypothetical protein